MEKKIISGYYNMFLINLIYFISKEKYIFLKRFPMHLFPSLLGLQENVSKIHHSHNWETAARILLK